MNESWFEHDNTPYLDLGDIDELARRIQAKNIPLKGILEELPMTDEVIFYTCHLDANIVDARWRALVGEEAEKIDRVVLAYNRYFIDDQGEEVASAVAVEVDKSPGALDTDNSTTKVRYMLPREGDELCTVSEERVDEYRSVEVRRDYDSLTSDELVDAMQMSANQKRPLSERDVKFLKLIISLA